MSKNIYEGAPSNSELELEALKKTILSSITTVEEAAKIYEDFDDSGLTDKSKFFRRILVLSQMFALAQKPKEKKQVMDGWQDLFRDLPDDKKEGINNVENFDQARAALEILKMNWEK